MEHWSNIASLRRETLERSIMLQGTHEAMTVVEGGKEGYNKEADWVFLDSCAPEAEMKEKHKQNIKISDILEI